MTGEGQGAEGALVGSFLTSMSVFSYIFLPRVRAMGMGFGGSGGVGAFAPIGKAIADAVWAREEMGRGAKRSEAWIEAKPGMKLHVEDRVRYRCTL